uniref:Cytochrome b5 heme-binding domain-containing protein n=1 Tax=Oryza punctata TaxID=4537 RepID=A0A0E0KD17_ORYPU
MSQAHNSVEHRASRAAHQAQYRGGGAGVVVVLRTFPHAVVPSAVSSISAKPPVFVASATNLTLPPELRQGSRLPPPPAPPLSPQALMAAQGIAEAVQAYTGLSPAAAVTILALMLATYLLVSSLFVAPDAAPPKPPPQRKEEEQQQQEEEAGVFVPYPDPVRVGEITLEQLAAYDGKDPAKPILITIRGQVYDVSRGRLFYGPQGPYSLFAGRDATRALALMSFDPIDLTGDLDGLGPDELEVLQDWEDKFKERYPTVGHLASENAADGNHSGA